MLRASTYIKLDIKLVLEKVLDVPTLSKPPSPFFITFQSKPVIVCLLVVLYILETNIIP